MIELLFTSLLMNAGISVSAAASMQGFESCQNEPLTGQEGWRSLSDMHAVAACSDNGPSLPGSSLLPKDIFNLANITGNDARRCIRWKYMADSSNYPVNAAGSEGINDRS